MIHTHVILDPKTVFFLEELDYTSHDQLLLNEKSYGLEGRTHNENHANTNHLWPITFFSPTNLGYQGVPSIQKPLVSGENSYLYYRSPRLISSIEVVHSSRSSSMFFGPSQTGTP